MSKYKTESAAVFDEEGSCSLIGPGIHMNINNRIDVVRSENDTHTIMGVPVNPMMVTSTLARTCIKLRSDVSPIEINTVEHLLAALLLTNCPPVNIIPMWSQVRHGNCYEVPIFDGSAKEIGSVLQRCGLAKSHTSADMFAPVRERTLVAVGDRSITYMPNLSNDNRVRDQDDYALPFNNDGVVIACWVDRANTTVFVQFMPGQAIQVGILQQNQVENIPVERLLAARTFGDPNTLESLQARGLAMGASHETARELVSDDPMDIDALLHKLLDLVGDLALIGRLPKGVYYAKNPNHSINNIFARAVYSERNS